MENEALIGRDPRRLRGGAVHPGGAEGDQKEQDPRAQPVADRRVRRSTREGVTRTRRHFQPFHSKRLIACHSPERPPPPRTRHVQGCSCVSLVVVSVTTSSPLVPIGAI